MYADAKVGTHPWPNLLEECLGKIEPDFKKHLAGNGMHVVVAAAVLLFC